MANRQRNALFVVKNAAVQRSDQLNAAVQNVAVESTQTRSDHHIAANVASGAWMACDPCAKHVLKSRVCIRVAYHCAVFVALQHFLYRSAHQILVATLRVAPSALFLEMLTSADVAAFLRFFSRVIAENGFASANFKSKQNTNKQKTMPSVFALITVRCVFCVICCFALAFHLVLPCFDLPSFVFALICFAFAFDVALLRHSCFASCFLASCWFVLHCFPLPLPCFTLPLHVSVLCFALFCFEIALLLLWSAFALLLLCSCSALILPLLCSWWQTLVVN